MKQKVISAVFGTVLWVPLAIGAQNAEQKSGGLRAAADPAPVTSGNAVQGEKMPQAARQFMMKAALGGMQEVAAARLALQKSSNDDVKRCAQQMLEDHSKANDELKKIADRKGVNLPTGLDAKHRKQLDRLGALSPVRFEREYTKSEIEDHQKTVRLFQKQAADKSDADLQSFAANTLPSLQHHLQMARQASEAVAAGSGKGETGANYQAADKRAKQSGKTSD